MDALPDSDAMPWFRKDRRPKAPLERARRTSVPEGLWVKCRDCREIVYSKEVTKNGEICPKCGHHFRIDVDARVALLLDEGATEVDTGIIALDPLKFKDQKSYDERLTQYRKHTGAEDAVRVFEGRVDGREVVLAVMDYAFMGGSMGSVVGEKITRAAERALEQEKPLIVVSASGGARMQEGVLSLMQMGKISAALSRLRKAAIPYISILTDPTTGGVTASFAMLGDLNIAEPGALIGFAGPRVIQQTIRQELPEGFQRSEFLLEHGFLDAVVPRPKLKATVATALSHLCG